MIVEYLVFRGDVPLSGFVFDAETYPVYKNCVALENGNEQGVRRYNLDYRGLKMTVKNAFDDSGKQAGVEISGEKEMIEKYIEFMQKKFRVELKQK